MVGQWNVHACCRIRSRTTRRRAGARAPPARSIMLSSRAKRVELAAAAPACRSSSGTSAGRDAVRRAVVLQEFGHRRFSPSTRFARITVSIWASARNSIASHAGTLIGGDHRHLRERELQRHRARTPRAPRAPGGRRHASPPRRRQSGADRPIGGRVAHLCGEMRQGRQHDLERTALRRDARDRVAEDRRQAADLAARGSPAAPAAAAGRTAAAVLRRRSAAARRSAPPADAPRSCRAARRAREGRRLERQDRQHLDRRSVASRLARHGRHAQTEGGDVVDDRDRAAPPPRTRRATRWVKSGLSMMTSTSGRAAMIASAVSRMRRRIIGSLRGDRRDADDRELVDRERARESLAAMCVSADAAEADIRTRLPQRAHQRGAEAVAGLLAPPREKLSSGRPVIARGSRRCRRRTALPRSAAVRDRVGLGDDRAAGDDRDTGKPGARRRPRRSAGRSPAGRSGGPVRASAPSPARRRPRRRDAAAFAQLARCARACCRCLRPPRPPAHDCRRPPPPARHRTDRSRRSSAKPARDVGLIARRWLEPPERALPASGFRARPHARQRCGSRAPRRSARCRTADDRRRRDSAR